MGAPLNTRAETRTLPAVLTVRCCSCRHSAEQPPLPVLMVSDEPCMRFQMSYPPLSQCSGWWRGTMNDECRGRLWTSAEHEDSRSNRGPEPPTSGLVQLGTHVVFESRRSQLRKELASMPTLCGCPPYHENEKMTQTHGKPYTHYWSMTQNDIEQMQSRQRC